MPLQHALANERGRNRQCVCCLQSCYKPNTVPALALPKLHRPAITLAAHPRGYRTFPPHAFSISGRKSWK